MQQGEPTRRSALSILARILNRGQTLEQAWAAIMDGAVPRFSDAPSDRAFVRQMVATALRHWGELEAIVGLYLRKPLPKDQLKLDYILRLGAVQLVYLKIPPHAAVNITVSLATGPLKRFQGLVNAVLHQIVKADLPEWTAPERAVMNCPDWLWSRLCESYGLHKATEIAEAHLREPPLDLCFRILPLAVRYQATRLPTGAYRRAGGGRIEDLPGYGSADWWVQDAGAQLPVPLLGDVSGKQVADLCAAPGGKTRQLLAAGATVTAVERAEKRARQLDSIVADYPDRLSVVHEDAATWQSDARFDAILLDAPCTATGTMRRHPDVPWVKKTSDIQRLAEQQSRLLANAAAMLTPGGRLVYCTCSLLAEEGEDIINDLLAREAEMHVDRIEPFEVPTLEHGIQDLGYFRTLPSDWRENGGIDGFFVARLRRSGEPE